MKKKYILIILFFSIIFSISLIMHLYAITKNYEKLSNVEKDLYDMNLKNTDNLMIVTHPDDETLWGGAELINNNYLVVCITCGSNKKRNNEFIKVMKKVNNKYISLNYPDKTNGQRDNWKKSYSKIEKDLKNIIEYKDWKKIVTHNPNGEYGHEQHIMTSNIVTKFTNKNNLYYFSGYTQDEEDKVLSKNILYKKEKLLKIYKTQMAIINNHYDTIRYKELISYNSWNKNKEKYTKK